MTDKINDIFSAFRELREMLKPPPPKRDSLICENCIHWERTKHYCNEYERYTDQVSNCDWEDKPIKFHGIYDVTIYEDDVIFSRAGKLIKDLR